MFVHILFLGCSFTLGKLLQVQVKGLVHNEEHENILLCSFISWLWQQENSEPLVNSNEDFQPISTLEIARMTQFSIFYSWKWRTIVTIEFGISSPYMLYIFHLMSENSVWRYRLINEYRMYQFSTISMFSRFSLNIWNMRPHEGHFPLWSSRLRAN